MDVNNGGTTSSSGGDGPQQGLSAPAQRDGYHRQGQGSRSSSGDDECDCGRGGCGPLLANNLAYFGAAVWFIAAVNVRFLPAAPFPVIGNALTSNYWLKNDDVSAIVPLSLWAIHYIRRFTEVLFVHKYTRRMPCGESIGASIYYWGFGFWIGYSANFYLGYYSPALWILIPGIILFIVGEVGNCAVHVTQRRMRVSRNRNPLLGSPQQRILPTGPLFRFVSCPNYTFEIVSWIGYALAVFTLPTALFLVASIITLVIYAYKKHKGYKEIFNGKDGNELYPPNRKALIPFIF